MDFTLNE